jgi:hypothetical protein
MHAVNRQLDAPSKDAEKDYGTLESEAPDVPKDKENRLGLRISLLILGIALLIATIWFISRPTFEKCSSLVDTTERNACYEQLRSELLKPPAK